MLCLLYLGAPSQDGPCRYLIQFYPWHLSQVTRALCCESLGDVTSRSSAKMAAMKKALLAMKNALLAMKQVEAQVKKAVMKKAKRKAEKAVTKKDKKAAIKKGKAKKAATTSESIFTEDYLGERLAELQADLDEFAKIPEQVEKITVQAVAKITEQAEKIRLLERHVQNLYHDTFILFKAVLAAYLR